MNDTHTVAISTSSQTKILSPQASSCRGAEKIGWKHHGVTEDVNYSLRHLNQAEILALKLFFESFETKEELTELLEELKNKSVISEEVFDKLCRLLLKPKFNKEYFSTLITQEISGARRLPCGLQYVINIIDQSGKRDLANKLVVIWHNIKMRVIPSKIQKFSAPRRKRIQLFSESMKKMIQDMVFKDPVEHFRNFSVKIKDKINSMPHIFKKKDLTELCDKYIASLTLTMDSMANKTNAIDPNDQLFLDMESILIMTSCPDLSRCMLYGRRAVVLSFANRKSEGDEMIKEALVCANRVSGCMEIVDTLYKVILYLRAWYEFFPQIITDAIYDHFTKAIHILKNEPDDIRLFWTRRFTFRLLFCYLGLGMRCRFIKRYRCSCAVMKEAERLIQIYDSPDAERRVQMYFAIAKSRLCHLKGDIDQALEHIQLAKSIAENGKCCELNIILETEQMLFLRDCDPLFVEEESSDSELVTHHIPEFLHLPNSLHCQADQYIELTNSFNPPMAPVPSEVQDIRNQSENARAEEWKLNTSGEPPRSHDFSREVVHIKSSKMN
eukprot:XP_019927136.1 PREDICTED: uncharacterized protein LOC105338632 [Crassostrea gigas]